ncbi:MAG: DUF5916 domain-containing protein [Acidobacteriota bacterium]
MKKITLILLILFNIVFVQLPGKKSEGKKTEKIPVYSIPSTDQEIKVDGKLDEKFWGKAFRRELNFEIMPGDNIKPPVRTEGFVIHTKEYIYVALKAYDNNPAAIRANYSDRDNVWNDDTLGVFFDTFNSGNRAFYFSSNPLGVQGDAIFSQGGQRDDNSWDAIWDSAGRISEEGYIVEMKIPFNAIQFSNSKDKLTWGLLFFRNYPRGKRYMISDSPLDRVQTCWLCQLLKVKGFKGATPGKNFELDPTLTAYRLDSRENFPDGNMEKEGDKIDPGLSGKWGVTSNLNLSFAVNPDFSQIEADAAQLEINTQYALYFQEKRPFFLEGNDFFTTPLRAVYTRSIADPDFGIKLSGKEKKHAVGLFVTRDNSTNLLFPGVDGSDDTTLEQKVWSSVARYRYDIGKSSTIGFIMTDREGENYFNRVGGVDGLIRISKSDTLTFQVMGSSTIYPEEIAEEFDQDNKEFSGSAMTFSYLHNKRNWNVHAAYQDYSPGFRADLGFIPQVNFRKGTVGGNYVFWGKKESFFSVVRVGFDIDQTTDHDGNLIEREGEIGVFAEGPLQSTIFALFEIRKYIYDTVTFNQFEKKIGFSINPIKNLRLHTFILSGDGIDYDNTRAGERLLASQSLSINLGRHVQLSADVTMSRLDIENQYLFKAYLSEFRLLYFFNRNMFIRGILQYSDIKFNEALYKDEVNSSEKGIFTQFLFTYKLNPRTVLYLGYSDIYEGYTGLKLLQRNRSVFMKVSYALVF